MASLGCFFVAVNCVSVFWVVQIVFFLLWIVLGCLGCLGLFGLFWAALACVCCFGLFGVAFGCSLIVYAVSSCFGSFRLLSCFRFCLVVLGCVRLLCFKLFWFFRLFSFVLGCCPQYLVV